jgi:hypothetical protein
MHCDDRVNDGVVIVVRVESADRRLLLRDIAEIAVGKRGPLKQVAANAARVNRCFVLIGTVISSI